MAAFVAVAASVPALLAGPAAAGPAGAAVSASSAWVKRALDLQHGLADDVGMRNAPWVGTHNSFNSTAEMGPTLSDTDSNQQLSLEDQLKLDVRSIELDLHWFPSAQAGGRTPVVCHAEEPERQHAGCTIEKPLGMVLDEIGDWLRDPAHSDQVLLLYLEDDLGSADGQNASAAALEEKLGDLIYRPAGGASCTQLPLALTRDQVLAAGKQVIVVSGCGTTAWRGVVFNWDLREEERPVGYSDFPNCGADFEREDYDGTLIRYYEDSTGVTAGAATIGASHHDDGITEESAAQMARCGVDLTGMDQLLPDDGRLKALVWSWADDEPRDGAGDCAIQRADARWEARRCSERHRAACLGPTGAWSLTAKAVKPKQAGRECGKSATTHSVPRTGFEGQLLRQSMAPAGAATAWLAYGRGEEGWTALDSRG
jgi:hypothetical protein